MSLIDVDEALRILLNHVRPLPVERVGVADALGYTLAAPVSTDVDQPPFDRSLMDGYALRAADVPAAPVTLRLIGRIQAGEEFAGAVGPGEAVQINTGAIIPRGADAVARFEDTDQPNPEHVRVKTRPSAGQFITRRAAYARSGAVVIPAGTKMGPLEIAAAAAAGAAEVSVYRQPRLATLSTGSELVEISVAPTGAQIRNSNGYLLAALGQQFHVNAVSLGIAIDDPAELEHSITAGLTADVLCITGGVSVGAFDFVPDVLKKCGITFRFQKLMIKPGRPTLFGTAPGGALVFGLPGNPISAFVGFHLLVRLALGAMRGESVTMPRSTSASLAGTMKATESRRSYLPGRAVFGADGVLVVTPLRWQGSGDAFGMVTANVLIMRPPHSPAIGDGDRVDVLLLSEFP